MSSRPPRQQDVTPRILGLGVQWVDVDRFEACLERYGDRLRERVFSEGERAFVARKNAKAAAESLAVRFAAKSAARRALGLSALGWQEVEVHREKGQAPTLRFHGRAAERALQLGVTGIALSLTHDPAGAVGQVVLEGAPA